MPKLGDILKEMKSAVDTGEDGDWTFEYSRGVKKKFTVVYSATSKKFTINKCIRLYYEEDGDGENYFIPTLYLHSYYYDNPEGVQCRDNPSLDHDVFFEFFTKLGETLRVEQLSLADASTKQFKGCAVPKLIFALSGRATFYEQHGFKNAQFTELVRDWRELALGDFLDLTESVRTKLEGLGLDETSTVLKACKHIIKVCKAESESDTSAISNAEGVKSAIFNRAKFLFDEAKFDNMFIKPIKASHSGGRRKRTRRR
jgi:hypothetical protein